MLSANLLLYLNLSGETFYIIVHRMKCQKIRDELQQKVYNDLGSAICRPAVIQSIVNGSFDLFQKSFADWKAMLDRVVHSSIMSVNAFSMEKLFELTLIATKYQYVVCHHPRDILFIGLNHLDSIRKSVSNPSVLEMAQDFHNVVTGLYGKATTWDMQMCRYDVLNTLVDVQLKMTNLIKLGLQKETGEFVRPPIKDGRMHEEFNPAGVIEYYKTPASTNSKSNAEESNSVLDFDAEIVERVYFKDSYCARKQSIDYSLELNGPRGTELGLSIYENLPAMNEQSHTSLDSKMINSKVESYTEEISSALENVPAQNKAVKGLDLCSVLLGCSADEANKETQPCSFNSVGNFLIQNETTQGIAQGVTQIEINAKESSSNKSLLAAIAKEFERDEKIIGNSGSSKNKWDISFDSDSA